MEHKRAGGVGGGRDRRCGTSASALACLIPPRAGAGDAARTCRTHEEVSPSGRIYRGGRPQARPGRVQHAAGELEFPPFAPLRLGCQLLDVVHRGREGIALLHFPEVISFVERH